MISINVQVDIENAMRMLNLLPREAERAAYRAINKVADEIKKDSAVRISEITGLPMAKVNDRMWIRGASAQRLIAVVGAMPSAYNVGLYPGSNVRPSPALTSSYGSGVSLRAWGKPGFYDKAFVKGKQDKVSVKRKLWRRTGSGRDDITDKIYGPSIRKTMERPALQHRQMEIITKRWPAHFERYLRAEIVRLRGRDALTGIKSVLPDIQGPTFTGLQ